MLDERVWVLITVEFFQPPISFLIMPVRDVFIETLKAGGSDDVYRILKRAGLDMATPEAVSGVSKAHGGSIG